MRILLFYFISLIASNLTAQKVHKITLNPERINLPNRAFHIEGVIDNRMNQQTIGFVQKGLGNKRVDAKFNEPLCDYLLKTFNRLIPKQNTIPVIAKVHNLYISERTTAWKEFGKAEVTIEFLTADSSRSWGKYFADVEENRMDATKSHDERIVLALTTCLEQLAENWGSQPVDAVDLATLSYDPTQPIKKGYYPTFSSFVKQEPTTKDIFEVRPNKKNPDWVTVHSQATGKKIKKELFGFFDGQDFYLSAIQYSYQPHFVKAHYTGTYFYFEDKVSDTGATIAFGLIGALASNKTIGIVLNTQTGLVSELNRDYLAVALKDYPKLKKWYNKSGKQVADKKEVLKMLNEELAKN